MKKAFVGYYTLSESEFRELWKTARIIVDANVLLAIYGLSPSTRKALLRLLESLKKRLWIPHQFALEYQRNRLAKILEQIKRYEDVHKNLNSVLNEELRSGTRHPFVSKKVESGLEKVCAELIEGKAEQEKLLVSDPYLAKTTELFEGRVGAPYSEADLAQAYDAARKRYADKIPPGFKDSDKPEPARFGDYVGWRQILDFGVKNNASVILVTDDAKEDWWRIERNRAFGPRPELIAEFQNSCHCLFYMYPSDRFLEFSEKYIGRAVDRKAISELKQRRESERRESESPAEPIKPTEGPAPEAPPIKSTALATGSDQTENIQDTPKLPGESVENPEEK